MLNNSALSQLKQLKEEIRIANPILEGTVKGTLKRFGFVVEPGAKKEYLLPQTEMEKVLPGDKVSFKLTKGKTDKDKPIAKIEKLIDSPLKLFHGVVVESKGQFFISPNHHGFNRWVFIPPKMRQDLNKGDTVFAQITKHPFYTQGKIQIKILQNIGQNDTPFFEHKLAIASHNIIEREWKSDEIEAIRQTAEKTLEELSKSRTDFTGLDFFTIDGPHTQDLDDAILIETHDHHWVLRVAIADVSSFVEVNSPLDKIAFKQASSLYLPGYKSSMLPDILSSDLCSLKPSVSRLALICQLTIDESGNISSTQFEEGIICSKAKLSYDEVDHIVKGENTDIEKSIVDQIVSLKKLTDTLQNWRQKKAIPVDDFFDYRYHLNDEGKLIDIEKNQRNIAHKMVEEAMLLSNMAAANFIAENGEKGLFLSHNGFKDDQKSGVVKFLSTYFENFDNETIFDLEGYLNFMNTQVSLKPELPAKYILRKKLNRSFWSLKQAPHFGLGLPCYTTFTSPIRKYSDLLTHRLIKTIINKSKRPALTEKTTEHLNTMHAALRNAQKHCEFLLKSEFIEKHKNQPFTGEIQAINHKQISVYLEDFDIMATLPLKKLNKKFKFKQDNLTLVSEDKIYQLQQPLQIKITEVDLKKKAFFAELFAEELEKEENPNQE